ncbi:MAG: cytochrome P450 [Alphaproteobacteria bacterium]|nr:cytochrome P450 [Alphaproteobacteria bacterium]MDE2012397.1 cytochrome P450 [Alphaproteobacteria bacterium]MDE2353206.1 cytochrome P450 [Alphaproteobacteria bacterium]
MPDRPHPSVFDLTPLNPAFNDDPHALLDQLRRECPVHRDETAGTFVLTRYADVRGVLSESSMWRHPSRAEPAAMIQRRLVGEKIEGLQVPEDEAGASILFLDDPDHARIREPLAKALYKRVAKCRPLVTKVVTGKLDALEGRAEFDAMNDFALQVPIDAIARILGVDEHRLMEFRSWSEGAILSLNPFRTPEQTAALVAAINALSAYFRELMTARRRTPRDDLVSDMVQLQAEGAPLGDGEISNNLQGLLIGGNLTTTDLIGNAIWLLLTHPDQLTRLKAEPALINSAVEEVLRYESPVDVTSRIAPRDTEVGGCPVKQAQSLFMSLRGANRDPDTFPDPHRFDIARKDAPHVAFGGGTHLCIGSPLARLEAQVALPLFFARFPSLRLADPEARPRWRNLPFFRGLKELPVAV